MATISAATTFLGTAALRKAPATVSSPVLGLPQMGKRGGRVRCSVEPAAKAPSASVVGGASSLLAAASVIVSGPAMALVDERMSTEGMGLSLGISNNLLGWILLAVFAVIWALYFVYTSDLEEDEESGLSL